MYSATKKKTSSAKQFVIVVGGSFNISFFFRTGIFFFSFVFVINILILFSLVLFLVILVIDFASSVYLFCTLFFTEVPYFAPPPSTLSNEQPNLNNQINNTTQQNHHQKQILMMIFILIQFNLHYFKALATALSDSGFSGSSGSNSSGIHS